MRMDTETPPHPLAAISDVPLPSVTIRKGFGPRVATCDGEAVATFIYDRSERAWRVRDAMNRTLFHKDGAWSRLVSYASADITEATVHALMRRGKLLYGDTLVAARVAKQEAEDRARLATLAEARTARLHGVAEKLLELARLVSAAFSEPGETMGEEARALIAEVEGADEIAAKRALAEKGRPT
jgi:hypothetical protein